MTYAPREAGDKTLYCDNPYEHGCGRAPAPLLCLDCGVRIRRPSEEERMSGLCLRCLNGDTVTFLPT